MTCNELRIGNWVKYPHLIGNVLHEFDSISGIFENNSVSIKSRPYTAFTLDSVNSIPLTEEWLEKFGFTKGKFNYKWQFGNFIYDQKLKLWTWFGVQLHDYLIEFVHQLQNLYLALTGQELTIK